MPSGPVNIVQDAPLAAEAQPQLKLCSACHLPLTPDPTGPFLPDSNDNAIVCAGCRDRILAERQARDVHVAELVDDMEEQLEQELRCDDLHHIREWNPSTLQPEFTLPDPFEDEFTPTTVPLPPRPSTSPSKQSTPATPIPSIITPLNPVIRRLSSSASSASPSSTSLRPQPPQTFVPPDPWVDITRIRVKSQGHDCLYPGATFCGTQRSGRNAYDVTVTVVDVDLSASFLCGYLRIRGLTEDHPELTTYFDAEIIGNRYGFLTEQDWGATETEDLTHWARFPAFRHLRPELRKPHLTMKERDRGVVFMRWKEKFLLPDHRVKDIHGASFAGFYYVCVQFGSQLAPIAHCPSSDSSPTSSPMSAEPLPSNSPRRDAFPSLSSRAPPATAVMTGFYFHQQSEPYQQLQLHHVPDRATSYFEFR